GAQQLQHQPFPPFRPPSQNNHYQTIPNTIIKHLKNPFPPQFLNPVHHIILFHKLSQHQFKQILTIILNKLTHPLAQQDIV
ncbi:hypothetical protein, partial [Staphylococcus pettenkoferi]|uniref:hypothetical protein n=1 Tax=Staphylococcus pettenkoferi TaxID=170573 RepID=UPI001C92D009